MILTEDDIRAAGRLPWVQCAHCGATVLECEQGVVNVVTAFPADLSDEKRSRAMHKAECCAGCNH